mmetsp:Transcript_25672/g.44958  ORF Transcript_25672/g.44958 Transcript_25672/m.44958 type:complete len:416 (-) Transcript_25672:1737-2984(-)
MARATFSRLRHSSIPLLVDNSRNSGLCSLTLVSKLGTKCGDDKTSAKNWAVKILALDSAQYENIQMSGGFFDYSFDQEYAAYSIRGPKKEFENYAKIIAEAVSRKASVEEAIKASKTIEDFLNAKKQNYTLDERVQDLWLPTAYGSEVLLKPDPSSYNLGDFISAKTINDFKSRTLGPNRAVFIASNIDETQASEVLSKVVAGGSAEVKDEVSRYEGGTKLEEFIADRTSVLLAYRGAASLTPQHFVFEIIKEALNGRTFGGSQRHLHFLQTGKLKQIILENDFIKNIEVVNVSFENSGSFGFKMSVTSEGLPNIKTFVRTNLIDTLQSLQDHEIANAKERLKVQVARTIESSDLRPKELGRLFLLRKVERAPDLGEYLSTIDSISLQDYQRALVEVTQSPLTTVAAGHEAQLVN